MMKYFEVFNVLLWLSGLLIIFCLPPVGYRGNRATILHYMEVAILLECKKYRRLHRKKSGICAT